MVLGSVGRDYSKKKGLRIFGQVASAPLNKEKLHLNYKGVSSFVRNFRDFLNVFETV